MLEPGATRKELRTGSFHSRQSAPTLYFALFLSVKQIFYDVRKSCSKMSVIRFSYKFNRMIRDHLSNRIASLTSYRCCILELVNTLLIDYQLLEKQEEINNADIDFTEKIAPIL